MVAVEEPMGINTDLANYRQWESHEMQDFSLRKDRLFLPIEFYVVNLKCVQTCIADENFKGYQTMSTFLFRC